MATIEGQKLEINLPHGWAPIYWGVLGLGGLLVLIGFGGKEYGYLIAACFLGIVARIVQAEHHDRLESRASPEAG